MFKISARLLLILTIASGSLLACGGSEDTPATPTSLAEKIAQTIEKKRGSIMQYVQFIYDKRNDLSNRDHLLRMPYERPW